MAATIRQELEQSCGGRACRVTDDGREQAMLNRQTALVNGFPISYLRAGGGPPLVLLHGIGGNATQFRLQLDSLSDDYTVVSWDAPGYGDSADPATNWTMADYADVLAGFLDTLDLDRVHLLGQSWGGVLAAEFYRHHPARVRSLVLSDTFAGGGAQPEAERQAGLQARLHGLETMTPAEMAKSRAPAVLAADPPAAVLAEVEAMLAEIRPTGYRQAAIVLAGADERDVLPTIRVPTLVIAGGQDRIVPLSAAEYLRDHIPGARLVMIPGAGHLASQEQPQRYNAELRAFLKVE
jgi:pimeloyl-ACP methyl ester carboxylesterase